MVTEQGTVIKIKSELDGTSAWSIVAKDTIKKLQLEIKEEATGRLFTFSQSCNAAAVCAQTHIENPLLWSIKAPNLYSYILTIAYQNKKEYVSGSFAFRELSADDKHIYLNGEKLFIRGYIRGIKCHDHKNNCRLSEYEYYKKNLTQAKKFGFNYVRFHSTIPPETLFKAADEVGMLIHIELRPEEDEYNNLEEMLFASRDLVSDEFVQGVIDEHYNHPSLAVYCIGNELKALGKPERIVELGAFIKKTDPTRLFVDTCAWGEKDRPNVDFDVQHMSYYFPFGKHANMFDDIKSIHTYEKYFEENDGAEAKMNVPLIAHEVCHYTALRDFESLKEKFEKYGVEKPWWIDEELKMISAKGLTDSYKEMYNASKHFQFECLKTAYEEIRKSRILTGFHFLQFSDTDVYENSNGIVDCFDDENYIKCDDFLRFNGDRVIMADFKNRLFFGGKKIAVPVIYSDYGEGAETTANFSYTLKDETGEVYLQESVENLDVSKKGMQRLIELSLSLPKVKKTAICNFDVRLTTASGNVVENSYKIWLYPKSETFTYREFCSYEKDGVTVTDDIEKALRELALGKKVCLIYRSDWTRHLQNQQMQPPMYAFKATWNRFKPVIWDRGTNYGGFCDTQTLNRFGFTTDRFYDFNYAKITEDCDKIILDDFPVQVKSILSGIDKNVRDRFDAYTYSFNLPELQYDRTLRNFSYLFEVGIGKGKLLVCGLNMTGLNENEPSALTMANFIIKYLHSPLFAPQATISEETFTSYLKECAKAPVKERMMTQFWELDDTPVESKEYWIESREYLL